MTTTMTQRVVGRHLSASSEKKELLWSSSQIAEAIEKLEDVYLVMNAHDGSGPPYEGYESIADGNAAVARAMYDMQKASAILSNVAKTLHAAGMVSKQAGVHDPLDGLDKRTVLRRANAVIAGAHLNGFFRDNHWAPVQRLWQEFEKAGIPVNMNDSFYAKDEFGNPKSKTWKFTIEWSGPKGQPLVIFGQVVADGAGSVKDPLDVYDVVAYVN